jgi:hypothetical protein
MYAMEIFKTLLDHCGVTDVLSVIDFSWMFDFDAVYLSLFSALPHSYDINMLLTVFENMTLLLLCG